MSSSGNFSADTLTQAEVVEILKAGTYPYKNLHFCHIFQGEKP